MSRKNKEVSRLRRELEILKTRLKYRETKGEPGYPIANIGKTSLFQRTDPTRESPEVLTAVTAAAVGGYLKKDLTRTFILSLAIFGAIFAFYFLESRMGEMARIAFLTFTRLGR